MAHFYDHRGMSELWRGALWAAGICALALLACKSDDKDTKAQAEPPASEGKAKAKDDAEEKKDTKPAEAKPAEAKPTDPAMAAPKQLKYTIGDVPDIPSGKSNPPQGTEWDQGVPVNTQGANSRGKNCSMHILREWLRIYCGGKVIGYEKMEDFGTLHSDYYEKIVPGKYASFVVRLRKGKSQKIRVCREGNRASLFVNWPPSKDKPVHVALSQGPACDGTDWGVGYGKKQGGAIRYNPDEYQMTPEELEYANEMMRGAQQACQDGHADACLFACGKPSCP
jgi:hypothetical protein